MLSRGLSYLLACLALFCLANAWTAPNSSNKQLGCEGRRELLASATLSAFGALCGVTLPQESLAFDNKISNKYDDRPKRRGSKPPDLGVLTRKDIVGEEYTGLKHCGAGPNCFCSTDSLEDDPDHSIPAWVWPQELGSDKEKAFAQLADVINAYEPGQANVDGGGFKIITNDPKKGYLYIQFESLKNGYIDDVELAYIDGMGDRCVQVRSSSRLGYLDFVSSGEGAKKLVTKSGNTHTTLSNRRESMQRG